MDGVLGNYCRPSAIPFSVIQGIAMRVAALILSGILATTFLSEGTAQGPASEGLQSPAAFQAIVDPAQRSRAIFAEIGKLLTHPRCMNCHPAADKQGCGCQD